MVFVSGKHQHYKNKRGLKYLTLHVMSLYHTLLPHLNWITKLKCTFCALLYFFSFCETKIMVKAAQVIQNLVQIVL